MRLSAALLLAIAVGLTSACGRDSGDGPTDPAAAGQQVALPRVKDVFGIGDTVYARSLAVDEAAQALWIGTSVGVHEVDLQSLEVRNTYTRDAGLANEYVFSIFVDNDGAKWFGTNGGGVTRLRDGRWQTFLPMHGLADYWVYAFAQQPGGALWIGTWAGASRYAPAAAGSDGVFTNFVSELVNEWVYGVAVDSRERVWFGTEGGVSMFDGRQWHAWTHEDELGAPNRDNLPLSSNTGLGTRSRHDLSVMNQGQETYNPNYVFCVYVADDDTVWAGTWGGGVSYFDGNRWHNLTTRDGLAGNIVFSITRDGRGDFWFGTNHGVSRYDGKLWQTIGKGEGLPDERIYALAATRAGDVWAGTRGSVIRIGR